MLERSAQSRPEPSPSLDLPVVGAAVMVRADGRPGGQIALAHHQRGDEKGVVVVLLMRGEDQIVEDLAARDG